MGGRGQASMTARGANAAGFPPSFTTSHEYAEWLRANSGIKIDESFDNLDTDDAAEAAEGIASVIKTFGGIDCITEIGVGSLRRPGALGMSVPSLGADGKLQTRLVLSSLKNKHDSDSMDGLKGTIAHEMGHALVVQIINDSYSTTHERITDYNKYTTDKSIMTAAIKRVKKTEYGAGKSVGELRRGISIYAGNYTGGKGSSEALAEAVDDYIVNGNNANPLSIEVVNELKKRSGS